MSLNLQEVFTVGMGIRQRIEIEPQSPIDFQIVIPADVDYVVLSMKSVDDLCMTVSSFDGNCTRSGDRVPVQRISADRKERKNWNHDLRNLLFKLK